ncbi:hypothetical protein IFM89_006725 [Coptis chinensis]|uniref:Thaumatin-like protein n=1 Tax=Coptis chinensis TaxID=261450 RepID=A0A835HUA7_9MAGN|nr:hypothetical protein IFM89_006725 [Coptis chinensis]
MKFLILLLVLVLFSVEATAAFSTVHMQNRCSYTIWPMAASTVSTPQAMSWKPNGLPIPSGKNLTFSLPKLLSVDLWARSFCPNTSGLCATGDCDDDYNCIPIATTMVRIISGSKQDSYAITLINGFNIPVLVTPLGNKGCSATSCSVDVNDRCPSELSVKDLSKDTIACKSACNAFKDNHYCCTGAFDNSKSCQPTSYSVFFDQACHDAISYKYDNETKFKTCDTGATYVVTFCP